MGRLREKWMGNKKEMQRSLFFISIAGVLLIAIITVGMYLYGNLKTLILDNQQEQLMDVTESVSHSMEIYLSRYASESHALVTTDQFREAEAQVLNGDGRAMKTFLEQIHHERSEELNRIDFSVPGQELAAVSGYSGDIILSRNMGSDETYERIGIYRMEDGAFCFGISSQSEEGNWLTMYVDCAKMYEETSGYLHMGANGYVMIKDSEGLILMHQVDAQIGIDVLVDRKEQYPDFDFSSLEVLIEHQLEGNTAVETYYSYWWADEEPHRTRKVSAYMPVYLGDDFLITSAVMDYDSVTGEISMEMLKFFGIFLGMLAVMLLFLMFLDNNMKQQRLKEQEIQNLRRANEELEKKRRQEEMMAHQQRLELIGTMTSGIAHEFNNLLTPIMGYSSLILAGMSEEDENYEDMKEIFETSEKAKEIISQINQFSSKGAEQRMQPIHVSTAVKKAIVITEAAKRRNITLVTHVEQENDVVMGNLLQIQQMVMNLCNNAIQAMGNEKGTLRIHAGAILPTEKENPFFEGRKDQWFYQIEVEDTGCGMSEEIIAQIFTPFFTTKRPGEGTGLGLAVVHRMVEAHQGLICVHSKRGEGTIFRIYLPLIEPVQLEEEPQILE